AYLGLRRREICGLRWKHVDLGVGLLYIQEVRTEVGGTVVMKSPKTRTSHRRLGIAGLQDLQQILYRAWERRNTDDPEEWVVMRSDGTPPKPDELTRELLQIRSEERRVGKERRTRWSPGHITVASTAE